MEESVIKGLKSMFKKVSPAGEIFVFQNIEFEFEMFELWECSSSFSSILELRSKVQDVRSLDMPKFGCSKFDFFEFVPTLLKIQ